VRSCSSLLYSSIAVCFLSAASSGADLPAPGTEPGYIHFSFVHATPPGTQDMGGTVSFSDTLGNGELLLVDDQHDDPVAVEPGYYWASGFYAVENSHTGWFYVAPGDTVSIIYQYMPREESEETDWPMHNPERTTEFIIRFPENGGFPVDGLSVYAGEFLRLTRISPLSYLVETDSYIPNMYWNLPNFADRPVLVSYRAFFGDTIPVVNANTSLPPPEIDSDVHVSAAELIDLVNEIPDEWIAPSVELNRILVSPSVYGNSEFYRYRFISPRAYFDRTGEDELWRILLTYSGKLVVLRQNSHTSEYTIPTEGGRHVYSPEGRLVLGYNPGAGNELTGAPWAVNTETGMVHNLQKLPVDSSAVEETLFGSEVWWTHLPADNGTLVSESNDSIVVYNNDLQITKQVEFPMAGPLHTIFSRRSGNGSIMVFFARFENTGERVLVCINSDAELKYSIPLEPEQFAFNTDLTTFAVIEDGVLSVINAETGSIRWQSESDEYSGVTVSPDGSLIGLGTDSSVYEIRSAHNGALVDSFRVYPDSGWAVRLNTLGNDGSCILWLRSKVGACAVTGQRFALRSCEGDIVWVSAWRRSVSCDNGPSSDYWGNPALRDFLRISSDGKILLYNDGCFIQILEYQKSPEY